MQLSAELVTNVIHMAESALRKIGAEDIPKKVKLALKFATAQPPEPILLDGKRTEGVAVEIATVFSPEGDYWQQRDDSGRVRKMESCQGLSLVIAQDQVHLCKSTYDVVLAPTLQEEQFVNTMYWTTDVARLTEKYIC